MKKFIIPFICATLIIVTSLYANKISSYIEKKITANHKIVIAPANAYAKNETFKYVSKTEDFIPYSRQDLLNILYSAINAGWDRFTFYCPNEYTTCVEDMEQISDDSLILTNINNYVHPYNSFTDIATIIYESGEIAIDIKYVYTEEKIAKIDAEVDRIIDEVTSSDKTDYENIKAIHDYIINHTKYDQEKSKEDGNSPYESNTAYGALFDHYAICNGYTDAMAIALTKLGYNNYKIATTPDRISYKSKGHVWNAVYFEDKWLHIDLTWDDPVSSNGKDYLYHKYFLVDNAALKEADTGEVEVEEHNFDQSIYLEFNDSIKDIISS